MCYLMGLPMVRSDETDILTGKEAQRVLGEILESERKSRSLTYPAHTGAVGFFYEKPKFVAFDNSSNDCWVEEFKTAPFDKFESIEATYSSSSHIDC